MILKKNTIPGNRLYLILILNFFYLNFSIAEEKIITSPLINVEEIKPSFEELDEENENISNKNNLKKKSADELSKVTGGMNLPFDLKLPF